MCCCWTPAPPGGACYRSMRGVLSGPTACWCVKAETRERKRARLLSGIMRQAWQCNRPWRPCCLCTAPRIHVVRSGTSLPSWRSMAFADICCVMHSCRFVICATPRHVMPCLVTASCASLEWSACTPVGVCCSCQRPPILRLQQKVTSEPNGPMPCHAGAALASECISLSIFSPSLATRHWGALRALPRTCR